MERVRTAATAVASTASTVFETALPTLALRREEARARLHLIRSGVRQMKRSAGLYDGETVGGRNSGWGFRDTGPDGPVRPSVLRARARDLLRNNSHAVAAVEAVVTNTVGTGIVARVQDQDRKAWSAWANSTACDVNGQLDFAGIQRLAVRVMVGDGEVLIVRERARVKAGLPAPLQVRVLEPDHLDSTLTRAAASGNNAIVSGIEYDRRGRRVAYHIFREHPSSRKWLATGGTSKSVRVPADDVIHLYRVDRAGQQRGVTWLAPVMQRLRGLATFEDATLEKQRVAACFGAVISNENGDSTPGSELSPDDRPDRIEPGMFEYLAPGETMSVLNPPSTSEYAAYVAAQLRAIAAGIGVPYEDLSRDLSKTSFASARIGWLGFHRTIEVWRRQLIIPRLCRRIYAWWSDAVEMSTGRRPSSDVTWTPPHREMLNPVEEVKAIVAQVRAGLMPLEEAIRARGLDPDDVIKRIAAMNLKLDADGVVLDTDPRRMSAAGQPTKEKKKPEAPPQDKEDDDDDDE